MIINKNHIHRTKERKEIIKIRMKKCHRKLKSTKDQNKGPGFLNR